MSRKQSRKSKRTTKVNETNEQNKNPQQITSEPQLKKPEVLTFSSMLKATLKADEDAARLEAEEKAKRSFINRTTMKLHPGWTVMYYDFETHKINSTYIPSKQYLKEPITLERTGPRLVTPQTSQYKNNLEIDVEPIVNDDQVLNALAKLHEKRIEKYDSTRYEGAFRELYPIYDSGVPDDDEDDYSIEYSSDEYYSDNDSINSFGRYREYDW